MVHRRHWAAGGLGIGAALLVLVVGASVAGELFGFLHANATDFNNTLQGPSAQHWFGTDDLGRDVFARCIAATRLDLQVGVITTAVPLVIGMAVGVAAGYAGGFTDTVVMRVMDVLLALPFIVLVIALVAIYGPGLTGVYVGLSIAGIPVFVRITRAETLVLREQQFMLAAQTLGFSRRRVLLRHALPHLMRPNLIFALALLVTNIVTLAALSYLGLGVQPPTAEWGAIIAEGQSYLLTAWWISTLPGLFMVVVCIALYMTGEGLVEMRTAHRSVF
jgi:peptide/nickel transport system permease protein